MSSSLTSHRPTPADLAEQTRTFLRQLDASEVWDAAARARSVAAIRQTATTLMLRWDAAPTDVTAEVRLRSAVQRVLAALPEQPALLGEARSEWNSLRERLLPRYRALVGALGQPEVPTEAQPLDGAHPRPENLRRSLVHALAGISIVVAFEHVFDHTTALVTAVAFVVFAWSLEIGRKASPALNDRLMAFFGPIAHDHEGSRVNSATWFGTALLILAALIPGPAAMLGVIALGLGDPMAALVGRRWGSIRIGAGRSLEGSAAFVGITVLAGVAYLLVYTSAGLGPALLLAAVAGLSGAAAELWVRKVDDNLAIPLVTAACFTVAQWFV